MSVRACRENVKRNLLCAASAGRFRNLRLRGGMSGKADAGKADSEKDPVENVVQANRYRRGARARGATARRLPSALRLPPPQRPCAIAPRIIHAAAMSAACMLRVGSLCIDCECVCGAWRGLGVAQALKPQPKS